MLRIITYIAVISFLAGCAQSPKVMEIPAMPVTQETNTPFIFKPHYQAKRVGIDEQKIAHHSDFATIVSEEEYVFAPRKTLLHPHTDNAVLKTLSVSDDTILSVEPTDELDDPKQPPAGTSLNNITENYAQAPTSMNLSYDPSIDSVCTNIACEDGSECGKILSCGSQTCDSKKQYLYNCTGSECQLTKTAIEYMDAAKFDGMCGEFGDLFQCPNKNRCK